jgi:NADH-quinone oxidoreductase subunit L
MLMTFYGAKRWQPDVHPHESPRVMTVPLVFLGIGSVFGGLVLNNWIVGWLDPAVGGGGPEETPSLLHFSTVALASLAVVAIGVVISVWIFGPRREIPVTQPESGSFFTLAGRNDLYGDAFNEAVFMRPGEQLTSGLVRIENEAIDGTVNNTAAAIGGMSSRLRRVQNGFVRSYALTMTLGAAIVGVVLVLGRLG